MFGHPDFINTPAEDLVPCPTQPDKSKYQREECAKITDESAQTYTNEIIKHTNAKYQGMVKLYMNKMPYYDRQPAIGYLDMNTGKCVIFHTLNSNNELKFWGYKKYKLSEIPQLLKDSASIKYANQAIVPAPTVPAARSKLPPMQKNIQQNSGGEL